MCIEFGNRYKYVVFLTNQWHVIIAQVWDIRSPCSIYLCMPGCYICVLLMYSVSVQCVKIFWAKASSVVLIFILLSILSTWLIVLLDKWTKMKINVFLTEQDINGNLSYLVIGPYTLELYIFVRIFKSFWSNTIIIWAWFWMVVTSIGHYKTKNGIFINRWCLRSWFMFIALYNAICWVGIYDSLSLY